MTPAELDHAVSTLLDHVTAARRALVGIKDGYARLDTSTLAVDQLGDELDPVEVLAAARAGLSDIDKANSGCPPTRCTPQCRYTSRLSQQS